ncbi:hypothetical protein [Fodinicurvata sp. EGI_FJ10296]|uniref:hypothetical protein n=1 Tax=Fodinicurvata sp. EGI_FJ10296 TaxID=3231908 RepID=UPI003452FFE6
MAPTSQNWEEATVAAVSRSRLKRGPHARAVDFGQSLLFVLASRSRPVYKLHATPAQALVWNVLAESRTLGDIIDLLRRDFPELRPIDAAWIVADLRRRSIVIALEESDPPGVARPRSAL